jgi:hypothetical protein
VYIGSKLKIGGFPGWRSEDWVKQRVEEQLEDDETYTYRYVRATGLWYFYIHKKDGKRD